MTHEMMHSLGIITNAAHYHQYEGDNKFYFSDSLSDPISIYDSNLRIYASATAPEDLDTLVANEMIPNNNGTAYIPIGTGEGEFDVIKYSPYFIGENTIKVLGGDNNYNTARQNILDNGGLTNYSYIYSNLNKPFPKVYGMPVDPSDDGVEYDLSHLELRNSYMSHQSFRNWLIPMEAELALMNDLGYDIDLNKYFGKSYYLNGGNEIYSEGFSKWDGTAYTGAPSTINQAVGIHIYGDNNNITQYSGDISIIGDGSFGVRVDGVSNTFTLDSANIYTNGEENIGIGVTWGKNHTININNGTQVTATGEDGIAASFDFGYNLLGLADTNIRGSFINYKNGGNAAIPTEINDELVTDFNVNGTLTGSKAAIYISDNAYVQNINIGNGAQINGDIISEWNSISTIDIAAVQTEETKYTNLNFNASSGVDVNGNITGDNKIQNTLKMNNATGSVVDFNGEEINVNSLDNKGDINIRQNTEIATVNNSITGNGNLNLSNNAILMLSSNINTIENSLNLNSATFDVINNSADVMIMSEMSLTDANKINVDVDIATLTSDILNFNNPDDLTVNAGATLEISEVNLLNKTVADAYTAESYYVPFVSAADNNQNLLGTVTFTDYQTVSTPIFKYNLSYTEDATQGGFLFSRGASKDYNTYNPAVVSSSVSAQFGGYVTQLNSYEHAFKNMDMQMLMTHEERQAYKKANLYASTETPKVFSPTYLPEKDKGLWFRPYATFENVKLDNGPKVDSISYGSYFGGDSPFFETKNGWDYQISAYVGYNGSHQNYSGNSVNQNGGTLGASVIFYKNNFFTSLTANAGAGVANAHTMYGSEDMTMLMAGVASKTGYNWELAKGKFIIQPSYLMSYSFVNTFDYTNAAGIRITSDPLNAINIAPGLKLIGNLKYGWQPYIGMQMVWNIMDTTKFRANNVELPNMSVKPYFEYGVGIQKRWGDRFTGFFQAMIRNGGRNGVALTAGFRWALGK